MGLLDYSEKEYIWVIELNSSGFYKLWFNEIMTFNCAQFCFNKFSKYIVSVCVCVLSNLSDSIFWWAMVFGLNMCIILDFWIQESHLPRLDQFRICMSRNSYCDWLVILDTGI